MTPALFILESVGRSLLRNAVIEHANTAGFDVTENIDDALFVIGMDDDEKLNEVDWQKQIVLVSVKPMEVPREARWFNPLTLIHWGSIPNFSLADMLACAK